MIGDLGRHHACPMVIVYPEAVVYGPVTPADVHFLVEEHLYKGRIVAELQATGVATPFEKEAPVTITSEASREAYSEFYQRLFFLRPNESLSSGRRIGSEYPSDTAWRR